MSRLEELIAELCPDGVEYKKLNDTCTINRGIRVVRNQLKATGQFPVFQNSLTPMGYHDRCNCPANTAFVIVAGAAGDVGYSKAEFWAADDCFYFICPETLLSRYLYYVLMSQQTYLYSKVRKASIPRLARNLIEDLRIPVPPLPVQSEIVQILDNFTELTSELTSELAAELAARTAQYEYYRERILSLPSMPYYTLEQLCDIVDYRGKTPNKVSDGIFLVTAKNIRKGYIDYTKSQEYISPADYESVMYRGYPQIGDILITTEAPCGNVAQVDREDIALAQRVIKYRPKSNNLHSGYLKHILLGNEFQKKLLIATTGGTVKGIKGSLLHKLTIPVPPLETQKRIVAILDRFDAFCNDLISGLSAEIAARQRQYEYYRDKLLSFPEK